MAKMLLLFEPSSYYCLFSHILQGFNHLSGVWTESAVAGGPRPSATANFVQTPDLWIV
jgi:hypothetical protein